MAAVSIQASNDFRVAAGFLRSVFLGQEKGLLALFEKPSHHSTFFGLGREGWHNDAAFKAMGSRDSENVYFSMGVQGAQPDKGRGKEPGVIAICGLWADIDILGPNHAAKNLPPDEASAWEIVNAVPFKPTVAVRSGGGFQMLWLFKEPFETETDKDRKDAKRLSKEFQKFLGGAAAQHGWMIDGTADLVRVLRVPGTYNRKQAEPVLVTYEVIGAGQRYNPSEFEDFLQLEADPVMKAHVQGAAPEHPNAEFSRILEGCAWMRHCQNDAVNLPEPEWYRALSVLARCAGGRKLAHELSRPYPKYTPAETDQKFDQAEAASGPVTCEFIANDLCQGAMCASCARRGRIKSPIVLGLPERKQKKAGRRLAKDGQPVPERYQQAAEAERAPNVPDLVYGYLPGDAGNVDRFKAMHGDRARYCHATSSWYVYDGRRWRKDNTEQVRKLAKRTMVEFLGQAVESGLDDLERFARSCMDSRRITSMLRDAQPELPILPDEMDTHPHLLNFLNGTLDLRTGELLEHNREHFITKLVHHNYTRDARCGTLLQVIGRAMGSTPDASEATLNRVDALVRYLQKAFGYSLTGLTSEKVVFLLHGRGDNGKSTLLTTFLKLLEEYSVLLQIDTLMTRQTENNNSQADLADLRGARFVMTSETEEGQRLAVGKLKRITQGMGRIKAVRKYENPIEFDETHKLWIDANFLPTVTNPTDQALWRRLHPVPFAVSIPKEEQDRELPGKLLAEAEGILAWAVEGAVAWFKEGLGKPPEVEAAGESWKAASDRFPHFVEERCILDIGDKTVWAPVAALWQSYQHWADENGEKHPLPKSKFDERLLAMGCKPGSPYDKAGKRVRAWLGIRFRTADDDRREAPDPLVEALLSES